VGEGTVCDIQYYKNENNPTTQKKCQEIGEKPEVTGRRNLQVRWIACQQSNARSDNLITAKPAAAKILT